MRQHSCLVIEFPETEVAREGTFVLIFWEGPRLLQELPDLGGVDLVENWLAAGVGEG